MKKLAICLLVFMLILLIGATACIKGGDGGGVNNPTGSTTPAQSITPANATATYGAEQFHIQLTAIAEQEHSKTP